MFLDMIFLILLFGDMDIKCTLGPTHSSILHGVLHLSFSNIMFDSIRHLLNGWDLNKVHLFPGKHTWGLAATVDKVREQRKRTRN